MSKEGGKVRQRQGGGGTLLSTTMRSISSASCGLSFLSRSLTLSPLGLGGHRVAGVDKLRKGTDVLGGVFGQRKDDIQS